MPAPRPSPTRLENVPTMNASTSTDRVTWRREAPRARNRASSRVRWATSMENVLRMTNAPTKTAMKAKTRKKIVKIFSTPLARSFLVSSASCLPVTTSV